jgi:hypothetical protein
MGVNLAGVKMIVEMEREMDDLRRRMEEMTEELRRTRRRLRDRPGRREATEIVLRSTLPRLSWEAGAR